MGLLLSCSCYGKITCYDTVNGVWRLTLKTTCCLSLVLVRFLMQDTWIGNKAPWIGNTTVKLSSQMLMIFVLKFLSFSSSNPLSFARSVFSISSVDWMNSPLSTLSLSSCIFSAMSLCWFCFILSWVSCSCCILSRLISDLVMVLWGAASLSGFLSSSLVLGAALFSSSTL